MRLTTLGMLLGACGAIAAVALYVSPLDETLSHPVATHGYRLWGLAAGAWGLGLLLGLAATALRRWWRPSLNRRARVLDYQVGLASALVALAAAAVGTYLVPLQMAQPLAAQLARDQAARQLLGQELARRAYSFGDARDELERLLRVGDDFVRVLFGTTEPGPEHPPIVALLRRYGMIGYAAQVDEQLQRLGWTPLPSPPSAWGYLAQSDEEETALAELVAKVAGKANQLKALAETVKPRPVELVQRWAEAYDRQARALKVGRAYHRPESVAALYEHARQLHEATRDLDALDSKAWQEQTDSWKKQADQLRVQTEGLWKETEAVTGAALADVKKRPEAEDVACALGLIEVKIPTYAQVAKQRQTKGADGKAGSWWVEGQGLKAVFEALRKSLDEHPLRGPTPSEHLAPVAVGINRLVAELGKALRGDTVPQGSGKPRTPPHPLVAGSHAPWSVEEVLKTVSSRLQLDLWDVIEIEVSGKKLQLVPAIRSHWDQDFYVLKKVTPQTHSRAQGYEHAHRVAGLYLQAYAAALARTWQARIDRVNEAKKGLHAARGDRYAKPVRELIRALFTESWWASRRDSLEKRVAATGFKADFIAVGIGENAGRVNASVEENRRMAEAFVARLREIADPDRPFAPDLLSKGSIWFTVFYAGDAGTTRPIMNPFDQLILIEQGVPTVLPPDARGADGSIDWSKARGPFEGGVRELNGAGFRTLLRTGPPPLVRPAATAAPGSGPAGSGGGPERER